jgi:hypothetical protein
MRKILEYQKKVSESQKEKKLGIFEEKYQNFGKRKTSESKNKKVSEYQKEKKLEICEEKISESWKEKDLRSKE